MKKKSIFWFCLWGALLLVGSVISAIVHVIDYLNHGKQYLYTAYTDYQLLLLFGFAPLCLIPTLFASHYYAIKESNKPFKILTLVFLCHHIICILAVLLNILGIFCA